MKENALKIIHKLQNAGFQSVYAGGFVRDMLMCNEINDIDIATDAKPEQVEALFKHTIPVGKAFGVIIVMIDDDQFEVATFRNDGKYSDGRRPDSVVFSSMEEDAKRRDLTINGMFFDPVSDRVFDFVGGQNDIKEKIIRFIGNADDRINDDKLRILRAIRFSIKFGFKMDIETKDAIVRNTKEILTVSQERIFDEIIKILRIRKPKEALEMLSNLGILKFILPEVEAMKGVEQPIDFHPEGDTFCHTIKALSVLPSNTSDELLMGTLLHDIGKPPTQTFEDRIRFNNHDKVGAKMTLELLRRLKCPNEFIDHVVSLVENHMEFRHVKELRESKLKRFMRLPKFEEHMALHTADCLSSHGSLDNIEFLNKKLAEIEPEEIRPIRLVTGNDLINFGFIPGQIFRTILTEIEDMQLEGQINNRDQALKFIQEKWKVGEGNVANVSA